MRTGSEAFDHHFGEHHFAYFAAPPELSELFDSAMASSASMFGGVAEVVDLSAAETVVDVAGGTGELLRRGSRAAPHVKGVLFERPHVLEEARGTFARPGSRTARSSSRATSSPACRRAATSTSCRASCTTGTTTRAADPEADRDRHGRAGRLLIVERLLPEDRSPSLAFAWDIHMLCNVGGRERTTSHYARLLADAGFALTERYPLPLDVYLLTAERRAHADDHARS